MPRTQFLTDHSLTAIAWNDSPDIGFRASLNPYRGCEHGCIYCYARPTHEYLGFSSGLDFETRIMVKERAPELLRAELASSKWEPQTIAMSGVTDGLLDNPRARANQPKIFYTNTGVEYWGGGRSAAPASGGCRARWLRHRQRPEGLHG